eukprot:gene8775-biopygen6138
MVWTGFVPEMPCVHGHFNQSVYCTCDPGWGTEHVPVGVQLPVFCNESDVTYWKHQTTMKPRAHLAPSLIIMLVVTGALVALLLACWGGATSSLRRATWTWAHCRMGSGSAWSVAAFISASAATATRIRWRVTRRTAIRGPE